MSDMDRQTLRLNEGDDVVLKYLGAAVVLQWHNLPAEIRQALRQQAESVGGLPASSTLRQQMTSLIARSRAHA